MSNQLALRNRIWTLVVLVLFFAVSTSPLAFAQPNDQDEGQASPEGADTGDLDEDDDDWDEAEPLALPSPDAVELNLEALGEMDPEKELAEEGVLSQQSAAAAAVESWTERSMDLLELHGYFRVRPELYHNFSLRNDDAVFNRPMVWQYPYTDDDGNLVPNLGEDCRESEGGRTSCDTSTLMGANMRFRLEPTLNVSEEIAIKAQIDFLDNVMLGSTPRYYQNYDLTEQIETGRTLGWDMGPPSASDMIVVRRAWGEVMTPFGQLRFGRMGQHWGLGMLYNDGNGLNQDFGDTVDRIMFAAKFNDWIAPAFDFPNEGVSLNSAAGRPFDVEQVDDAYQLVAILAYKHDAEEQEAMLKRGDWVVNTGLHFAYRWQQLSFENPSDPYAMRPEDFQKSDYKFYRRDSWATITDVWFQFINGPLHLELEAAFIYGNIGNPDRLLENFDLAEFTEIDTLLQYGGVLQADYGLMSDQLRLGAEFGFASGDEGVEGLRAPATYTQANDPGDNRYTAFAFNPGYNTDLILYRHLLGAVSQSYYIKPLIVYDFLKSPLGKRLALRFDLLYSRAVFSESTINNNSANLGVELDGQVFYRSEDGFYAGLKYGVLFPLAAFEGTWDDGNPNTSRRVEDLDVAQTLQVMFGITY